MPHLHQSWPRIIGILIGAYLGVNASVSEADQYRQTIPNSSCHWPKNEDARAEIDLTTGSITGTGPFGLSIHCPLPELFGADEEGQRWGMPEPYDGMLGVSVDAFKAQHPTLTQITFMGKDWFCNSYVDQEACESNGVAGGDWYTACAYATAEEDGYQELFPPVCTPPGVYMLDITDLSVYSIDIHTILQGPEGKKRATLYKTLYEQEL